jgi:putative ABC transport system substrate-binding protein
MRRREFIALMGASATWPFAALAQEPGLTYRLGVLLFSPRNAPYNVALLDALKPDGFIDGKNLVVDDRGFGLHVDELADHASAIVKAEVDVIVLLR